MITAAEVRAELKLQPEQDKTCVALRDAVLAQWEAKTRRLWTTRTDLELTIEVEDTLQPDIWVDLYPITDISIVEYNAADGVDAAEDVDEGYYEVKSSVGRITRTVGYWKNRVLATITGGYDAAPPDVWFALMTQIKFLHARYGGTKIDIKSQGSEGGYTSFISGDEHPLFAAMVKLHRRAL